VEHTTEGFAWTQESWGRGLRAGALAQVAAHVFTTRDLPLGSDEGEWQALAASVGARDLARLRQVHGAAAAIIRSGKRRRSGARPEADILVSDDPAVAIAVQAADCVPLLIADPQTGAVAAAHAGWRGLSVRVPQRAVRVLADTFGAAPSDLIAAIGPSIGPCCYEVGAELQAAFDANGFPDEEQDRWFSPGGPKRLILDLWTAAADQLAAAGVPRAQIAIARLCTAHRPDLFPSYRRDRQHTGRMAAAIRARGNPGHDTMTLREKIASAVSRVVRSR
jgi:purine-nucleoside/S-methyl-5'-thioadenosine phosphorylase / adenosine deaminase